MEDIERGDVEILVRAGASSRPQDDARQRAMVEAYLGFKPAKRHILDTSDVIISDLNVQAQSQLQEELAQSTQEERESAESWKPNDENYGTSGSPMSLSFMDSPELSFLDVLHNNESPAFRGRTVQGEFVPSSERMQSRNSTASQEPPKSIISDFQPGQEPHAPEFASPTKALENYYRRITTQKGSSQTALSASVHREKEQYTRVSPSTPEIVFSLSQCIESSPLVELPSSPSPDKQSQRRSARILQKLENLSSSQDSDQLSMSRGRDAKFNLIPETPHYSETRDLTNIRKALVMQNTPPPATRKSPRTGRITRRLLEVNRVPVIVSPQVTGLKRKARPISAIPGSSADIEPLENMTPKPKRIMRSSAEIEASDILDPSNFPQSSSFPLSLPSAQSKISQEARRPSSQPEPDTKASSTNVPTSSAGSAISPWLETLEINSKPPATSYQSLKPEMLITLSLQRLVDKMSVDNPFVPLTQTRDLRSLERGNWVVDCSSWNDGLRARAWDMLGGFVGQDKAGWGVRCVRSENHDVIKVFCWGIVVEHTWFMLFLASEGKIKQVDAKWVGGDGVPIIRMR